MSAPIRILFVCMGNICRSPAAEGIFKNLVDKAGFSGRISCDSAGTIGFHGGEPPDRRMRDAASKRGYDLNSQARQIEATDLMEFDFILTMDRANLRDVRALDPDERYHEKILPLTSFCPQSNELDVPDPYYGGKGGFDTVLDLVEEGCQGFLEHLQETRLRDG